MKPKTIRALFRSTVVGGKLYELRLMPLVQSCLKDAFSVFDVRYDIAIDISDTGESTNTSFECHSVIRYFLCIEIIRLTWIQRLRVHFLATLDCHRGQHVEQFVKL